MNKILVLSLTLFSRVGFTQSNDLWAQVDEKVYQEKLCDAFIDGRTYRFSNKNCTWLGCDEYNYFVKTFCRNIEDGTPVATLEHWGADGNMFSRETIQESDWLAKKRNLLRYRAAFVESFGNLFLLKSTSTDTEGRLRVDYIVQSQAGNLLEEGYWIFGEGPSVPQVLERIATKYSILKEESSQIFIE